MNETRAIIIENYNQFIERFVCRSTQFIEKFEKKENLSKNHYLSKKKNNMKNVMTYEPKSIQFIQKISQNHRD